VIAGTIHDASWLVTDRTVGASQGAFAFGNLAVHVGDEPAAVALNRAALARDLGVRGVVFTRAAHSSRVAYVEKVVDDVPGVDALITDRPDLAIAAQGADCAMVALATSDGWIAAVHCGWQGLVEGVVANTAKALVEAGADVDGGIARLGPNICARCYPVDADRAATVSRVVPEAVGEHAGSPVIDVRAGVLAQLAECGVRATADERCTREDHDLYSYRRDGVTGRQAIAVVRGAR
jgi:hypothetical protein